MSPRTGVVLCAVLASAATVSSQSLLFELEGSAPGGFFGEDVATIGDINGDGRRDILVGARYLDAGGLEHAGRVHAIASSTGHVLWSVDGDQPDFFLGWTLAAVGDVDGDGIEDAAAAAPGIFKPGAPAGEVWVLSGKTGLLLRRIQGSGSGATEFGFGALAAAGDWNADGTPDVLIGEQGWPLGGIGPKGRAKVCSGATGAEIWVKDGASDFDHYGCAAAAAGDWDGDGEDELAIGSWGSDLSVLEQAVGKVVVVSSQTHATLLELWGENAVDQFGYSVAAAGDVNADGWLDLLVGAPGGDYARVRLGPAGAPSHQLWATQTGEFHTEGFGWAVDGAGDVDADGFDDLVVGGAGWVPDIGAGFLVGRAYVFSGADGALLFTRQGDSDYDALGRYVAGGLDANADGLGEVVVGVYGHQGAAGSGSGRIDVVSATGGSTAAFGAGPVQHGALGQPAGGGLPVMVSASGGAPFDPLLLGFSLEPLDLVLSGLGTLYLAPPIALFPLVFDAAGELELALAPPAVLAGSSLYSQVWGVGPVLLHSNGVAWNVAVKPGLP